MSTASLKELSPQASSLGMATVSPAVDVATGGSSSSLGKKVGSCPPRHAAQVSVLCIGTNLRDPDDWQPYGYHDVHLARMWHAAGLNGGCQWFAPSSMLLGCRCPGGAHAPT